jgi:diketogulonate reductase-like aldo/keto reductase
MERRAWGSTGSKVPAIGQGTWHFEQSDRGEAIAALRRGLELGLTHIDTAELYGEGAVEELVGEAIEGRRDEVFLVSKVLPSNASFRGTLRACERSLRRLHTDYLNCYLLHWRGRYELDETLEAFEHLLRDGKIRSWGVSNFDIEDLRAAARLVEPDQMACNQVLYHLEQRTAEQRVLPWLTEHGISMVAYSPLGSGQFPSPSSNAGSVLARIAQAHDATPHQVALAFLTRNPSLLVIPKAATVQHVEENAAAANLRLADTELALIDEAFRQSPMSSLPTL